MMETGHEEESPGLEVILVEEDHRVVCNERSIVRSSHNPKIKKKPEYLLTATISLPPPAWMKELQSTPIHLLARKCDGA